MGDKGFLIADLTTKVIHHIFPPLKVKRFTRQQVEETCRIARGFSLEIFEGVVAFKVLSSLEVLQMLLKVLPNVI